MFFQSEKNQEERFTIEGDREKDQSKNIPEICGQF